MGRPLPVTTARGACMWRATGRGDSGANRVRTQLASTPAAGTTVTLRAKVRWLKGNPNVLLRLRGNWLEAPGFAATAVNLGTPGAPNSVFTTNTGPAITEVAHWPPLPATNQAVLVTARAHDPDAISTMLLKFRVDPSAFYTTVVMTDHGAGFFSGTIPGQLSNKLAAFLVTGADKFGAFSTFPDDAPKRECSVMWGDTNTIGSLPAYRFWITQTNMSRWVAEEKMSNNPKDVTFVYGTNRIVYNAGAWFHGSPYHSPGYNSPLGNACDYDLAFPPDDRFLGETDINLYRPGNGGSDSTGQAEIIAHWWANQFGLPFLFHRPVFVIVNGLRRQTIYHDSQQPNGDFIDQWFNDDADGELHKIQVGFEFGNDAYGTGEAGFATVGANLNRYLTTGGAFHQARYRQTWPLRSVSPSQQNNYTNLFVLVNAAMTAAPIGSSAYSTALTNATDVEEWYRVDVVQHLYENNDSYSWGGGQNAFSYKPQRDRWKLLLWDVDFAFGNGSGKGTNQNLLNIGGADHGPRNDHPPFRRIYWQLLQDAANSFLSTARSAPLIDARYAGLVASGANVVNPTNIKSFIEMKRSIVLAQIAGVDAPFSIASNGGADFSSSSNTVTLSGLAPIDVRTLEINGIVYTPTWTTMTNWTLVLALPSSSNNLAVLGRDATGNVFSNGTASININVTAATAQPQDFLAINELMYAPNVPGGEYVEIYNRSTNTSFDLSNWRLDGAAYTFPGGSLIQPQQYLVLVNDASVFTNIHGANASFSGVFPGNLQGNGETLTLIKPSAAGSNESVIDKVRYGNRLPWPEAASGTGSALQLTDVAQDNSRPGNWQARYIPAIYSEPVSTPAITNDGWRQVTITSFFGSDKRLLMYLDFAGSVLLDDLTLVAGTNAAAGFNYIQNGGFESPLDTNVWVLATNMTGSSITGENVHVGTGALQLVQTSPGGFSALSRDLVQMLSPPPPTNQPGTLSFWFYATNTTATNFTIRIVGSSFTVSTNIHIGYVPSNYIPPQLIRAPTNYLSPGRANNFVTNIAPFVPLWINELQAENLTGIQDSGNEREPWIEIYNAGTNTVSLDGLFLAGSYTNLLAWEFPAGQTINAKQFKLVFADGQTNQSTSNELHTSFRLPVGSGALALSRVWNGATQVLDYIDYTAGLDHSYGSAPDGQPFERQEFYFVTPGATNNPALPPIVVSINEWMADNASTLADPADDAFEDWFEIYNPGTNAVSLGGYYLTDVLTNKTKYLIPAGYTIPPRGYLLVWADGEPGQNSPSRPDLHADLSLLKTGEAIGLFTPDGIQIDAVVFEAQSTDVSMGRFADGAASVYSMTNPTPRAPNTITQPNAAPILAQIADQTVVEGAVVSVVPAVTDSNYPPQSFAWSLGSSAPGTAAIDPLTGAFAWPTTESDGGNIRSVTLIVTDSGTPALSATQTFNITVLETNTAPVISPVTDQAVAAGTLLTFNIEAWDSDIPAQGLMFSLDPGAPAGATFDASLGVFSWMPASAQAGQHQITARARDSGKPALEDSVQFSVTVTGNELLQLNPVILSNGVVRISWTTEPGASYRVEFNTNLATGGWHEFSTNTAAGSEASIVDTVTNDTQRIYRILRLP